MVTARQKSLVEASWAKVSPMALQVAELFYDRLFELDPLLEEKFERELTEQGPRLMRAVGMVVAGLDDLNDVLPVVRDIGRRHVGYGVTMSHYTTFGKAWLWTLEQSLAEDFTTSVKDAWTAVYGLVSSVMIEAAEGRDARGEPESSVRHLSAATRASLRQAR